MTTNNPERDRAIALALKAGLYIAAKGYRTTDGARVVGIPSESQPNQLRIVAVEGDHLSCDCPRHAHGKICKHRGYLSLYLSTMTPTARTKFIAPDPSKIRRQPETQPQVRLPEPPPERTSFSPPAQFSIFKSTDKTPVAA